MDIAAEWRVHGDRHTARLAAETLLGRHDLPNDLRERASSIAATLARSLTSLAPSTRFLPITFPTAWAAPLFNPSIASYGDRFKMIVRQGNFSTVQSHLKSPGRKNPWLQLREVNWLLTLDPQLAITSIEEIVDETTGRYANALNRGFSDCRLFPWHNHWMVTASAYDRSDQKRAQFGVATLANGALRNYQLISDADDPVPQKNWIPLASDSGITFLKWLSPFERVSFDPRSGLTETRPPQPGHPRAVHFRGGSQGVRFEDGWLAVIHEKLPQPHMGRPYLHRLIRLDATGQLTHLSHVFCFFHRTVEYCAGLALQGDRLILSFGYRDRSAWLAELDIQEALALLHPVDAGFGDSYDPAPSSSDSICAIYLSEAAGQPQLAEFGPIATQVDALLVQKSGHRDCVANSPEAAARFSTYQLVISEHLPVQGRFAAALDHAGSLGYDWAVLLQPGDSFTMLQSFSLRKQLAGSSAELLSIWQPGSDLATGFCVRLPAARRPDLPGIQGFRHVAMRRHSTDGIALRRHAPDVKPVDELTLNAHLHKRIRADKDLFQAHAVLAELSLADGDRSLAIDHFKMAAEAPGSATLRAWACFQSAQLLLECNEPVAAMASFDRGLTLDPAAPELAVLAGRAALVLGDIRKARAWADLAVQLGAFSGCGRPRQRHIWRRLVDFYEAPYQLLSECLASADDPETARVCLAIAADAAVARRLAFPLL